MIALENITIGKKLILATLAVIIAGLGALASIMFIRASAMQTTSADETYP